MILVFATAVVVTTEFMAVGLLPVMARDLGISLAEAGSFVWSFAIAAAILGPFLTIVASGLEPRRVLVLSMLVFGLGNLAATLIPNHPVILAVRIVQGAMLPLFVSIGSVAVARLAGPGREGRAVAHINIGVVIGTVFAVPAGVLVAERTGWPTVFASLGLLAIIATVILASAFPRLERPVAPAMKAQARIVQARLFQAHLLLSGLLFTAMFVAYTYLAAYLDRVGGFDGTHIAAILTGFGVAGLFGNWAAGRIVDRGPTAATAGAAAALALATTILSLIGGTSMLLLPVLAFWGAAHTAAFVLCQVRVMLAGKSAPAFASSLNISVCNLGIALGAAGGGWIVDRYGIEAIGFGSAVLAAASFVLAILMREGPNRVHPGAVAPPAISPHLTAATSGRGTMA